jgi:hypothetical protein
MFAITWTVHLSRAGVLPLRIPFPLSLLGGWGFAVAAVIMTWLTLGRAAVGALLKRFLLWRIGWKWYASLLIIPGAYLLGMFAHALVTGVPPDFRQTTAHRDRLVRRTAVRVRFLADVLSGGASAAAQVSATARAVFSAGRQAIWAVYFAVHIRSFNPADPWPSSASWPNRCCRLGYSSGGGLLLATV